tara:strand:+ start:41 stop:235 length:195 start_codon:yes stop_codon:yes gene_type:complete
MEAKIKEARKSLDRMASMLRSRLHDGNESEARFNYLSEDEDCLIHVINTVEVLYIELKRLENES